MKNRFHPGFSVLSAWNDAGCLMRWALHGGDCTLFHHVRFTQKKLNS